MAGHHTLGTSSDPRLRAVRRARQYERDLRLQLATSQLAAFFHLLCSEFRIGWLSRSVILTWVALRRHLRARCQVRRAGR